MYTGIIYRATNRITNKSYIGQTIKSLEKRKSEHYYNAYDEKNTAYNCHFYRAVRKHGKETFEWDILCENVLRSIISEYEIFFIDFYCSFRHGYNMTPGGEGGDTIVKMNDDEIRTHNKKISDSLKNRKKSLQHVLNVANANRGKFRTKESKINISIAHGGKPFNVYDKATGKFVGSWVNQSECAEELGCNRAHVSSCLSNEYGRKSSNGYIFKYDE